MPEKPLAQVGRVAFRVEGESWNAYYALPDTMKDALLLGSIRFGAVAGNAKRKAAFMEIMRDIVTDIIEERLWIRPTWGGPNTAPEHERSGSA